MVDCFKIFSLPPMKGPNLVVMSRSGGQAVTLADEAYRHGFTLPALPPAFSRRVREEAKAGVIRSTNPLDLGDVFNDALFPRSDRDGDERADGGRDRLLL